MANDMLTVKCVVVGDGAVGKTCLLIAYARDDFPKKYVPTVFDNYAVSVAVGGQDVTLTLFDTAGQEDYDRLRPLSYSNANIFLVCFSVANRVSFENVRDKWFSDLRRYSAGTPFILVGTQADLRSSNRASVSINEANKMARDLGAVKYLECSALTRAGVKEVFAEAIVASLDPKRAKGASKKCIIA